MKKIFSALSLGAAYLTLTSSAFAATINACASSGDFNSLCAFGITNLGTLVGKLISLVFVLAVVAALFYLVWGGFKWLTSGGDKQAVTQAREHIVAAIIGLVVIFLSYLILNILIGFFVPGVTLNSLTIPTL